MSIYHPQQNLINKINYFLQAAPSPTEKLSTTDIYNLSKLFQEVFQSTELTKLKNHLSQVFSYLDSADSNLQVIDWVVAQALNKSCQKLNQAIEEKHLEKITPLLVQNKDPFNLTSFVNQPLLYYFALHSKHELFHQVLEEIPQLLKIEQPLSVLLLKALLPRLHSFEKSIFYSSHKQGWNLLHYAAKQNNFQIIYLVFKYATPNQRLALIKPNPKQHHTPMHIAAIHNSFEFAKELLKYEFSNRELLFKPDATGNSLLHLLALNQTNSNNEFIELWLTNASYQERDWLLSKNSLNKTPLDCAIEANNQKFIEILLSKITPKEKKLLFLPTTRDNQLLTPIHLASQVNCKKNSSKIMHLLEQSTKDDPKLSLIFKAAQIDIFLKSSDQQQAERLLSSSITARSSAFIRQAVLYPRVVNLMASYAKDRFANLLPKLSPSSIHHTIQNMSQERLDYFLNKSIDYNRELVPFQTMIDKLHSQLLPEIRNSIPGSIEQLSFEESLQMFISQGSLLSFAAIAVKSPEKILDLLPYCSSKQLTVMIPLLPSAILKEWIEKQDLSSYPLYISEATLAQKIDLLRELEWPIPLRKKWKDACQACKRQKTADLDLDTFTYLHQNKLNPQSAHVQLEKKIAQCFRQKETSNELIVTVFEKLANAQADREQLFIDINQWYAKKSSQQQIPEEFLDPFTQEIMSSPVRFPQSEDYILDRKTLQRNTFLQYQDDRVGYLNPWTREWTSEEKVIKESELQQRIQTWQANTKKLSQENSKKRKWKEVDITEN